MVFTPQLNKPHKGVVDAVWLLNRPACVRFVLAQKVEFLFSVEGCFYRGLTASSLQTLSVWNFTVGDKAGSAVQSSCLVPASVCYAVSRPGLFCFLPVKTQKVCKPSGLIISHKNGFLKQFFNPNYFGVFMCVQNVFWSFILPSSPHSHQSSPSASPSPEILTFRAFR